MRHVVVSLAVLTIAGCFYGQIKGGDRSAEPLDKKVTTYVVRGDEFKIVERELRGGDELALIAIQRRNLNRAELRALARHLAGKTKRPSIELLASSTTYAACIKTRMAAAPAGPDPASSGECKQGTVLSVESPGTPVLRWGAAAPKY